MSKLGITAQAVEDRLVANWTRTPVWYEGDVNFDPPSSGAYVRPTVVPAVATPITIGPSTVAEVKGTIFLDVFAPRLMPAGAGLARAHGDALADLFRMASFSGVQCSIATVRPIQSSESDPFIHIQVSVPYRRPSDFS